MTEPDVSEVPCPACGQQTLVIEMRLEAKPHGTYSLAGQQMKIAATEWPWIKCTNCQIEARGKYQ